MRSLTGSGPTRIVCASGGDAWQVDVLAMDLDDVARREVRAEPGLGVVARVQDHVGVDVEATEERPGERERHGAEGEAAERARGDAVDEIEPEADVDGPEDELREEEAMLAAARDAVEEEGEGGEGEEGYEAGGARLLLRVTQDAGETERGEGGEGERIREVEAREAVDEDEEAALEVG